MLKPADQPIIKIVKKGAHEGAHGGAWKVAYADFVTAMMAFFLVMWILGLSEDNRKAIAAYFNDPIGFAKRSSTGIGMRSQTPLFEMGPPITRGPRRYIMDEFRRKETDRFKHMKQELENLVKSSPEFKNLQKVIDIQVTQEGLRIELLDGADGTKVETNSFFDSGSAKCQPRTITVLRMIAAKLREMPNGVKIEGHTDSRPYGGGSQGYTNWNLSSDRANAALKAMQSVLRSDQILSVDGLADRHLRVPQDPYHYSNRRVSILLPYQNGQNLKPLTFGRSTASEDVRPNPVNIAPPQPSSDGGH